MHWGDILCDRALDEHEIRRGVAAAFGIDGADVAVVSADEDLPDELPFVILRVVGGDVACRAEVHLADEHLGPRSDALVRFSRAVGCRVLSDTELDLDVDPYDWTLAEPSGRVQRVTMVQDDDEDEVYRMR